MNDGVYVTDSERNILYWNNAAERLVGWTSDEIVGRSCFDNLLCHEDNIKGVKYKGGQIFIVDKLAFVNDKDLTPTIYGIKGFWSAKGLKKSVMGKNTAGIINMEHNTHLMELEKIVPEWLQK